MSRNKVTLLTTWTYPPQSNGVSAVSQAHAEGLASLGNLVTVATGYDVRRTHTSVSKNPYILQFDIAGGARLGQGYTGKDILKYKEYIANFKGDAILFETWGSWNSELALETFLKNPAKKILISHGVSFNGFGIRNWVKWLPYKLRLPKTWRAFDHVVFLYEKADKKRFYDKKMAEQHGFSNWSVIPNGTYPERFTIDRMHFRSMYSIYEKKMILCVSNYDPMKNQEMALRAFFLANVKDAILIFIGSKINQYALKLQKMSLSFFKGENKVIFLEDLDEYTIRSAYSAADLFLCPSKTEIAPLVVLDAMASGTPFISMDVGCVSEFPGGIIVKSEEEMASKIIELLSNNEKHRALSEAGSAACAQLYNWKSVILTFDKLIERLTSTSR